MDERYSRTVGLIGEDAQRKLIDSSVAVIGIGGVGSYAAEALARSGIGSITLMDGDDVAESNLNRQLVALTSTIGRNKAEVMAERIHDIDPKISVRTVAGYYGHGADIDLSGFDFVVDAIDDVDAKIALIKECMDKNVKIVSAMGAARKFGTAFRTADISETSGCPLARVVRRRLRAEGIAHLPVVFSTEKPAETGGEGLGSMSYVPGSAGLEMAGYVIRQIIRESEDMK